MSKIPRPNPSLEQLRDTWSRVLAHLPQLQRAAAAMAAIDRRLDPEDLLEDSIADIVASEHLYREKDASWLTWAKTRVWKTRTYALRDANKHNHRGRLSVGVPDRNADTDSPIEPALAVGADGTAERAESRVTVGQVLEDAWEHERDAMLVLLYGWDPKMAGGKEVVEETVTALIRRMQDEAPPKQDEIDPVK
jgi:DNA-directed RNA polymerase specialized sigma24 family protein